jgi:hypothetical protein
MIEAYICCWAARDSLGSILRVEGAQPGGGLPVWAAGGVGGHLRVCG